MFPRWLGNLKTRQLATRGTIAWRSSALFGASYSSSFEPALASLELKGMGLLGWFLAVLAFNWLGFLAAVTLKTEAFYDAFGALSFMGLTIASLVHGGNITPRSVLVSSLVLLWAVRLASYLVPRIMREGSDCRFDEIKKDPKSFFIMWTGQAVWAWTVLLPVLVVNGVQGAHPLGRWSDVLGVALYLTGLTIEVVADWQKSQFKARPENKGQFINEGLWAYARHPNYFGEMVLWWGVFFTSMAVFKAPHYATVVSPLFVFVLLRYGSGVPPLEKLAHQRWGDNPEYKKYVEKTNRFIPLPKWW